MADTAFGGIVEALERNGSRITGTGNRRQAQCPAHDDSTASLSVTAIEGQALVYCHAQCDTAAVLDALGLSMSDLFDTSKGSTYCYGDGRVVHRTPAKKFRQSGNTQGTGVLYRVDRVRAAVAAGRPVYVVEGEKDVHALESLDVTATCSPMGAGKAHKCDWSPLAGAAVYVVADRDEPGQKHAAAVHRIAAELGATVTTVRAKVGKDAADHVAAGYGTADLVPEQLDVPLAAVLTRLADVTPEPVTWLWPGRLPAGKLVMLDGDPSLGKSTLALTVAAHISTGRDWPDSEPCPLGDVVMMSAEDGLADTIRPRLDAAEGDAGRVHALTAIPYVTEEGDRRERLPTLADLAAIRGAITATAARLLVVDVLMAYLPGKVDSHRDQDVRGVLHQLGQLAEDTSCTVLLLRHLNKSGVGGPMYRGGGSIGIIGAARAGFLVAPDPDDENVRVLACTKSNLAPTPPSLSYRLESAPGSHVARMVWVGESKHAAAALLRHADPEERTERDEAAEFIRGYLTDNGGSSPSRDVLKAGRAAGFTDNVLKKARARAGARTERQGFGPGASWVWTIDAGIDAIDTSKSEPVPMEPMPAPMPLRTAADADEDRPCDRCSASPSRLGFDGGRYCRTCAPTLWADHTEAS